MMHQDSLEPAAIRFTHITVTLLQLSGSPLDAFSICPVIMYLVWIVPDSRHKENLNIIKICRTWC